MTAAIDLATIFSAIASLLAVAVALIAVNQTRRGRSEQICPELAFEPADQLIYVGFRKRGFEIPNLGKMSGLRAFAHIPVDAEMVTLAKQQPVGKLVNLGSGSAFNVVIFWQADTITFQDGTTRNTSSQAEAVNFGELEGCESVKHLMPGDACHLSKLPAWLEADYKQQIRHVAGTLVMSCKDAKSKRIRRCQEFFVTPAYSDYPPSCMITFGKML